MGVHRIRAWRRMLDYARFRIFRGRNVWRLRNNLIYVGLRRDWFAERLSIASVNKEIKREYGCWNARDDTTWRSDSFLYRTPDNLPIFRQALPKRTEENSVIQFSQIRSRFYNSRHCRLKWRSLIERYYACITCYIYANIIILIASIIYSFIYQIDILF